MRSEPGKWKSKIAQESFVEMCQVAGLERDKLMEDIRMGEHSGYEKGLLRANASKIYLEMIGNAYSTASFIETNFLGLNAGLANMCMNNDQR